MSEKIQATKSFAKQVDVDVKEIYLDCLKTRFGHPEFREGQWDAINSILGERRDTFLSMPAASGKSLCYQFPSVFLNTITVVVSPLIAGMQGEVRDLESRNVRACYLGSSQENSSDVLEGIKDDQYNIVYATPEYIRGDKGHSLLTAIRERLTLIAVDEVYYVFDCGSIFRPKYAELHKLREWCPGVPIVAVTAAGSPAIRDFVIKKLGMNDVQVITRSLNRPNLEIVVSPQSNNVPFLDRLHPDDVWNDIGPYIEDVKSGSIIVECIHRPDADFVSSVIRLKGYPCASYHAGVDMNLRNTYLREFLENQTRIICGTVALGVSIQKPDIRLIILYGATKDLESCLLKFGNAGRDGLPSKCIMFYKECDWINLRYLRNYTEFCEDDVDERMEESMKKVQDFVKSSKCRRRFILSYIGENCDTLQTDSNCCDNCRMK